ncbi:MAG TPA: PQQ-binding-like beta-propeller repeat protein [Acetobacteraceae bacterium]|nr:PQQ-binding-like beta-propeller repeat protein [Acetobacteraceae bacterium]
MPRIIGRLILPAMLLLLLAWIALPHRAGAQPAAPAPAVTTYHADAARTGHYRTAGLTWAAAASLTRDTGFDGRVPGHVYAQPLFWQPQGAPGLLIVATEDDIVIALDASTGKTVWQTRVGTPVPLAALSCGNVDPLGITGTPVIDPAAGAVYLDAMVNNGYGPRHEVFGLHLADGAVLPGWPIDVGTALTARGIRFFARDQNQRTPLTLLDGRIYLGYGGHAGDCGQYHGMVLGFSTSPPGLVATWVTRGAKAGIWSPGGISVADGYLYFATGNSDPSSTRTAGWDDSIGAFRVTPSLQHSADPADFFAPRDYPALDDDDLDLAGTVPLPIDLPGGARRLLAMGKDGNAYLLDRLNLGGIGGALVVRRVANGPVLQAPVTYRDGGRTLVVYRAPGAICPDGRSTTAVVALSVTAGALTPAWCAPIDGRGIPMVTTTGPEADPIVWVAGAEGDERLHGYRGDTGVALYASDPLPGLRHFVTPMVAAGRIYLAGDGRVFAFRWRPDGEEAQR